LYDEGEGGAWIEMAGAAGADGAGAGGAELELLLLLEPNDGGGIGASPNPPPCLNEARLGGLVGSFPANDLRPEDSKGGPRKSMDALDI
jgi:hypothetical protein